MVARCGSGAHTSASATETRPSVGWQVNGPVGITCREVIHSSCACKVRLGPTDSAAALVRWAVSRRGSTAAEDHDSDMRPEVKGYHSTKKAACGPANRDLSEPQAVEAVCREWTHALTWTITLDRLSGFGRAWTSWAAAIFGECPRGGLSGHASVVGRAEPRPSSPRWPTEALPVIDIRFR